MSARRTVHDEKQLAAALKERADHIEIMGSLSGVALRIMMLDEAKWAGVARVIGASIPILLISGGVVGTVVAASVVGVLGAAAAVGAFWLAYYSGNLDALNTLRIYRIACNSGDVLVVAKPGDRSADYLPKVGTEAWDALNQRRAELIDKDLSGNLNDSEREELEHLERICDHAIDKAFPLPPADLDSLIQLRNQLRGEKA
jgi:hypothetical protein